MNFHKPWDYIKGSDSRVENCYSRWRRVETTVEAKTMNNSYYPIKMIHERDVQFSDSHQMVLYYRIDGTLEITITSLARSNRKMTIKCQLCNE